MPYQARHRTGRERRRRHGCLSRVLTFILLVVLIGYPFLEPFLLETEYVTLTASDLSQDIGTLRIVYLSDIHQGPFYSQGRVAELVSRVNALNPDLILLGGDYANDSDGAIDFFKNAPAFHARYAVCAVVGNHDRTIPESNLSLLKSAMFSAGVTPLVNEVAQVRIGSGSVYIAGIDDVNNGYPDISLVAGQVKSSDYVIFLSHSPEAITDALKAETADGRRGWYDLGLFGHTHGGQVALLGQWLGISNVPTRYGSGWIQENRIDMLISRGVGTSVLPIRVLRRPQIHVITVKSGR